jgi:hypothetical protein
MSGFSYMTYTPNSECFASFYQAGVRLFCVASSADSLDLWGNREVWVGPDKFDYSGEDSILATLAEAAPEAFIFPRVHAIGPRWWAEKHPEELVAYRGENGTLQLFEWEGKSYKWGSWASEKFLAVSEEAIRRYVLHMRQSPYASRIIGYQICSWAVGEWMAVCVDASAPMTERFRAFLERKYRTVDALRDAWGDTDVRFDTAEVPYEFEHRGPASQSFYRIPEDRPIIDYWENYGVVVSDAALRLCRAAKEASEKDSLAGVFFGYLLEFASHANFHGHTTLHRVLESPHVDFVSSPSTYRCRDLRNGYTHFMSLIESVKLHGKIWWDENDYRTYLVTPAVTMKAEELAAMSAAERRAHYDRSLSWRRWGGTESVEDSIAHQDREVAQCLCRGAGMWWFDMGAGWYAEPRFMKAIGQMYAVAERSVAFDRSSVAEAAVVVDARSLRYTPPFHDGHRFSAPPNIMQLTITDQIPFLMRAGVPLNFFLLEDIMQAPDHKLWIFLNCFAPDDHAREDIRRKVQRNGQTALWIYAPGVLRDGKTDLDAAYGLTGIRLALQDIEGPLSVSITEAAHPITAGLYATVYGAPGALGDHTRFELWLGQTPHRENGPQGMPSALCRPWCYGNDPEAAVLGYLTGSAEPGLLLKHMAEWTSVYSAAAPIPPALLRNLAKFAGVHVYLDTDDIVHANASFLSVTTNSGGPRTIRLPRACDVVDTSTGMVITRGSARFDVDLPAASTRLYFLGGADQWQPI